MLPAQQRDTRQPQADSQEGWNAVPRISAQAAKDAWHEPEELGGRPWLHPGDPRAWEPGRDGKILRGIDA